MLSISLKAQKLKLKKCSDPYKHFVPNGTFFRQTPSRALVGIGIAIPGWRDSVAKPLAISCRAFSVKTDPLGFALLPTRGLLTPARPPATAGGTDGPLPLPREIVKSLSHGVNCF